MPTQNFSHAFKIESGTVLIIGANKFTALLDSYKSTHTIKIGHTLGYKSHVDRL